MPLVPEPGHPVAGLAVVVRHRQGQCVAVDRRQAPVEQGAQHRELPDIGQAQIVVGSPGQGRGDGRPLRADMVAPAVAGLARHDQTGGQAVRQGAGEIQLAALQAVGADGGRHLGGGDEARGLGHHVDATGRVDVAEQGAGAQGRVARRLPTAQDDDLVQTIHLGRGHGRFGRGRRQTREQAQGRTAGEERHERLRCDVISYRSIGIRLRCQPTAEELRTRGG